MNLIRFLGTQISSKFFHLAWAGSLLLVATLLAALFLIQNPSKKGERTLSTVNKSLHVDIAEYVPEPEKSNLLEESNYSLLSSQEIAQANLEQKDNKSSPSNLLINVVIPILTEKDEITQDSGHSDLASFSTEFKFDLVARLNIPDKPEIHSNYFNGAFLLIPGRQNILM